MKRSDIVTVYGITGGIGAGKSRVLSYVGRRYHARIIRADEVGKQLMEPGKPVYNALVGSYGRGILNEDGSIDKKKVAAIGFRDRESQEAINRLEHGIIRSEIIRQIARTRKPVVFLEAALLIEGGLKELCRKTIYVYAPEEVRIRRLMSARGYSEEKCRMFLSLQLDEKTFRDSSDHVLRNDRKFSDVRMDIDDLMKKLGVPERNA